jgi:hypothetical protein
MTQRLGDEYMPTRGHAHARTHARTHKSNNNVHPEEKRGACSLSSMGCRLAVEHHREECKGATLFLAHHSTHSPTPQLRAHHSVVRPPARALWAAGTTAVSTSVTASHRNMSHPWPNPPKQSKFKIPKLVLPDDSSVR